MFFRITQRKIVKFAYKIIPDSKSSKNKDKTVWLDERLLASPPLATSQCRQRAKGMAKISKTALQDAIGIMFKYDKKIAATVESTEQKLDTMEDKLTAKIKNKHIERMKAGLCKPEPGVHISNLLIFIERISDHYSNVAVIIIQTAQANVDKHDYLNELKSERNPQFVENYEKYKQKYKLVQN